MVQEEEDDAAEGEASKWIRVFYPHQACFIYKHALMGLYESTLQHIITVSYMLPNADDKRKVNVSRKKMRIKKGEKKG
jgi:hypothetical protein